MIEMHDLVADARVLSRTGHGRQVRESADVSIEELAAAIGVRDVELMAWESGRVVPRGVPASDWVRLVRAVEHRREAP